MQEEKGDKLKVAELERRFFQDTCEGVFLTNLVGKIVAANQAVLNIFGKREEEIIGLFWQQLIAPKHFLASEYLLDQELLQNKITKEETVEYINEAGQRFRLYWQMGVLTNEQGKPNGRFVKLRDCLKEQSKEFEKDQQIDDLERYIEILEEREAKMLELKKEIARLKTM